MNNYVSYEWMKYTDSLGFFVIITVPSECEFILFPGAVNEKLSDLLKRNQTLHTAETALITVLSPL